MSLRERVWRGCVPLRSVQQQQKKKPKKCEDENRKRQVKDNSSQGWNSMFCRYFGTNAAFRKKKLGPRPNTQSRQHQKRIRLKTNKSVLQ